MIDPLKQLSQKEIIEQFEDRSTYCKKCGTKRFEIKLDDMPEEFIKVYKEDIQDKLDNAFVSFLYCYPCNEYSKNADNFMAD